MRSNIERRQNAVAQLPEVSHSSLDYDDGEVVILTLLDEYDEERVEDFADRHGLEIVSGPKYVEVGVEVILR